MRAKSERAGPLVEPEPGSIIMVSNRLPVTLRRERGGQSLERSSGGLVAALDPAVREIGGTWVGWPGAVRRVDCDALRKELGYDVAPVMLTPAEVRRYYCGFSNRTLWPLFHSLTGRIEVESRDWAIYETVNERFAAAVDSVSHPGDLVWIHDYHLLRVGAHLRERLPDARLAFFLHIPFPPLDIYGILPWSRQLLEGLLACDLVGFHCESYVSNFLDCVERLLGARVDRRRGIVEHGRREVRVGAFPLGIDFEAYDQHARCAPREVTVRGPRTILGVDRLDYTKGIPERLLAFERLLELHKRYRGRVSLVQLAVPSRSEVAEYRALKREIDELVGRVNGRFGTPAWTPIRYLYGSVPPERLAAMYRDADVALITPLRDGMNLVAKEYVACQIDDPGVLVLSKFAGAAERMREALLVNPYDVEGIASALHRALGMRASERAARIARLQERERRGDLHAWLESYLTAATDCVAPVPEQPADLVRYLEPAQRREIALFLDYDGTLTPIVDHPSEAALSKEMAKALADCAQRCDTSVTVVSGRAIDDLQKRVNLAQVSLVGNHGLELLVPGLAPFEHPDVPQFQRKLSALAASLREIFAPGGWVEEKGATLTFHLRAVDAQNRDSVAREARERILDAGFQARAGICAIEARPPIGWDKGQAVLYILRSRYGPDWTSRVCVICIGDDQTDEDMFRALSGLALTFRVGSSESATDAGAQLAGVGSVRAMLEWLAARPPV